MTETERNQIKGALLKCAEENENKLTLTGHIVVSSLCKSAVERIEELEKENAELKNRNSELAGQKASLERWYGEAKELIGKLSSSLSVVGECEEEECELLNRAEEFLKEVEK